MNFLLFLLLIGAGEVAYFAMTVQQQTNDGFQQQESAWQSQDDSLRAENQQLLSAKNDLLKDIASTQADIDKLTNKLPPGGAPAPGPLGTVPAPANQPAPATTSLGTISTTDGQKFADCHLLKVEPDGITFSHSQGITKVQFSNLSPELQKSFEVDPQTGQASDEGMTKYEMLIQKQAQPGNGASQ